MSESIIYIDLLKQLISTPSISRNENATADLLYQWFQQRGITVNRQKNNIWATTKKFNPDKPIVMLNSHHDTVPPAPSYTVDPYCPLEIDGKIYGLGSNDAGASVVSLAETFCRLYDVDLPFNLLIALTAEEEISGENGMRALLPHLYDLNLKPEMAIVGEPTSMNPAIGERGLVVLDCVAHGVTGHAARNEGVNALYLAIDDINALRNLHFEKESALLGPIKITATIIEAGRKHNVIPEECKFTLDVRTTDAYTNLETVELIQSAVKSDVTPRSTRINASAIPISHPLVVSAIDLGGTPFVSPTTSDMALMPDFPTLKIGPGQSSRSHSADEFIEIESIKQAVEHYTALIKNIKI